MNEIEKTMSVGFEQQPGECGKAFAAFVAYLKLGPERSLSKAAAVVGKSKPQLERMSRQWKWVARAEAYQAHLARMEREGMEGLVRERSVDWAARHEAVRQQAWKEAEGLIALAQEFKARWQGSERLPDFGAVVRALELAFRLKQFAAGMPSEVKQVNTTVTGTVDVEWEIALKKIYGGEGRAGLDDGKVVEVGEVGEPARIGTGEKREESGDGVEAEPASGGATNAPVGGGEA